MTVFREIDRLFPAPFVKVATTAARLHPNPNTRVLLIRTQSWNEFDLTVPAKCKAVILMVRIQHVRGVNELPEPCLTLAIDTIIPMLFAYDTT